MSTKEAQAEAVARHLEHLASQLRSGARSVRSVETTAGMVTVEKDGFFEQIRTGLYKFVLEYDDPVHIDDLARRNVFTSTQSRP